MSMRFGGFNGERERRLIQNVAGDSMAKQEFKQECDINVIMKKFERTGMLNHAREFEGGYGDFTDTPVDYQEAMNIVIAADSMFATVPAKVRAIFENDPGKFLEFVENPENLDKCRELGLAVPKAEDPAPVRVEVVNPPAADDGNSST